MSSRQRVLDALAHREPDQVPIGIGSSGAAIHDEVYAILRRRLYIEQPVEPFRRGHGDNYYDDRIYQLFGSDIRHVFLNFYRSDHFVRKELGEGGVHDTFIDAWGVTNETRDGMHQFLGQPLEGASTVQEIDHYNWPDPYGDAGLVEGLVERAKLLQDEGCFAISSRSPMAGIFETCWLLRGLENFLVDLVSDPPLAIRLIDKVTETLMKYYDILLGVAGPYLDIVETQDDYGMQTNTLMSPMVFRKYIKPARSRMNDFIRRKAPQAKIYLHSCGSIRKLIPDLIETGVDILNPIQPLAQGMNTDELKKEYGADLTFYGAIDMQQALPGSAQDVIQEVRRRITDLAPGGGYILAPANVVHRDVPLENLDLLVEETHLFGRYPIAVSTLAED